VHSLTVWEVGWMRQKDEQPLLYVTQPHLKQTPRNMQQSFYIRNDNEDKKEENIEKNIEKAEQETKEETKEEPKEERTEKAVEDVAEQIEIQRERKRQKQRISQVVPGANTGRIEKIVSRRAMIEEVKLDEILEDLSEEVEEEIEEEIVPRKPFKEMTMEERVVFLVARPHYIPKVKCRVSTGKSWYIGYITELRGNMVFIKTPTRLEPISFPLGDIQSLQMIGTYDM
jgi:hypothetical protein